MSVDLNKGKELLNQKYKKQLKEDSSTDITTNKNNTEYIIENYNKSIEKRNAKQKYKFRNKLLKLVSFLIWFQLIFFNLVIIFVISSLVFNCTFFKSDIPMELLSFLKYYISVTIVELLGMLWFVMKYVFKESVLKNRTSNT